MRVAIVLPPVLRKAISHRLREISSQTLEIMLVDSDALPSIPTLQPADGLLITQCRDFYFSQKTATAAESDGMLYGEIALYESPFAEQYGFMVAAGGKAESLRAFAPLLNALAPQPNAWWHVGDAGSAAFLLSIQDQLSHMIQYPINFTNPFPQLKQIGAHQQNAGQLAKKYLEATDREIFIPTFAHQIARPLASFINDKESPARQIARMISTLNQDCDSS